MLYIISTFVRIIVNENINYGTIKYIIIKAFFLWKNIIVNNVFEIVYFSSITNCWSNISDINYILIF